MFKAIILLTRREDMSRETFSAWLLGEHSLLAAQLPGLRRLTYNVVATASAEDAPDGVAELWFDSQAAFEAAYATELGKAVAADSLAHVTGRVRLLVTEHEIAI